MSRGSQTPPRRIRGKVWATRLIGLTLVLGVWQGLAWAGLIDPLFIASPLGMLGAAWNGLFVTRDLLGDLGWTVLATALGFTFGSIAGMAVGFLFFISPALDQLLQPFMTALNSIPRIALAPLVILWFGLGLQGKVFMGASLTFFVVLGSVLAGTRGVDPDLLTLADVLGATKRAIFLKITIPSAIPTIFEGLRLGLIYSLLGVVSSEIIASSNGLGQRLSLYAGTFQTDGTFAVLLIMSGVGVTFATVASALESRLIRWR